MTAEARKHVVTKGDSLSKIARRYYGDAKLWQKLWNYNLIEANNASFTNDARRKVEDGKEAPNFIYPREVLLIPDRAELEQLPDGAGEARTRGTPPSNRQVIEFPGTEIVVRTRTGSGRDVVATGNPTDRKTVFEWFERSLVAVGAVAGKFPNMSAEKVFYLPTIDGLTPIAEGRVPVDWEGYHAGKHGLWERFENLKGESVNMGEAFWQEKYRWVRSEFKDTHGGLKYITQAEFDGFVDAVYKNHSAATWNLAGIMDSKAFTRDVAQIAGTQMMGTEATIWQGRYLDKSGNLDALQTNVDFIYKNTAYRIAMDAKTGRVLNFFRIEPGKPRMKFAEVVVKWRGVVTNVKDYVAPGATLNVDKSASLSGLIAQGVKKGAAEGLLPAGIVAAACGFKKEGIPGALKGMAIALASQVAVGGLAGGLLAMFERFVPLVAKSLRVLGRFLGVIGVTQTVAELLTTEISLDSHEWAKTGTDDHKNVWAFRNIKNEGSTLWPKHVPHGMKVRSSDGVEMEAGTEFPWESSWRESSNGRGTPLSVLAEQTRVVHWVSLKSPDGSRVWWWTYDDDATEEVYMAFPSEADELEALQRHANDKESGFSVATDDARPPKP